MSEEFQTTNDKQNMGVLRQFIRDMERVLTPLERRVIQNWIRLSRLGIEGPTLGRRISCGSQRTTKCGQGWFRERRAHEVNVDTTNSFERGLVPVSRTGLHGRRHKSCWDNKTGRTRRDGNARPPLLAVESSPECDKGQRTSRCYARDRGQYVFHYRMKSVSDCPLPATIP